MRVPPLRTTTRRLAESCKRFHCSAGLSAACGAARLQHHCIGQGYNRLLPPLSTTILQHRWLTTHNDSSTIYALASAPGRAAIAIIRISGPACLEVGTTATVSLNS